MTLLEPDVALTDYGLAVESAILAWLIRTRSREGKRSFWFALFFAALAVSALLGGTAHGFIADKESLLHQIVWNGTLLAIGASAVAGWAIGAHLIWSDAVAAAVVRIAFVVFLAYTAVVLFIAQSFAVAVIHYLPAAAFLLAAFGTAYFRCHARWALVGAGSIALMFAAAVVQQSGIDLHPQYFNHNALYHLIQAIALFLLYRAVRKSTTRETHQC